MVVTGVALIGAMLLSRRQWTARGSMPDDTPPAALPSGFTPDPSKGATMAAPVVVACVAGLAAAIMGSLLADMLASGWWNLSIAGWLVAEVLRRLRAAGARHASLYVDGLSPMKAYDVYRKLGFEVVSEAEVWEATFP